MQKDKNQTTDTVKFLNFETPEIFAIICPKFIQRKVFCQNGANGKANSEDTDQTAPRSALFAQTCLSQNLGSLG